MNGVEICASWIDGKGFSDLWEPISDANDFLLISCFVTETGWTQLEKLLQARVKQSPTFRAKLYFSLAGLSATGSEALVDKLQALSVDELTKGRIEAFVVKDSGARLFHPKGHASRNAMSTKVVVGSANLTGAMSGFASYELMTIINDDHEVYERFHQAVVRLVESGAVYAVDAATADHVKAEVKNQSGRGGLQVQPKGPKPPVTEEGGDAGPAALPDPIPDLEALAKVRGLLRQGGILARLDQLDNLTVPIPLDKFRDAGLIAATQIAELGPGVKHEAGGSALGVALVPLSLQQQISTVTKPLGRLVGRFTLDLLGSRWIPLDWVQAFQEHWGRILPTSAFVAHETDVRDHMIDLDKALKRGGRLRQALSKSLTIERPTAWHADEARRVLNWPPSASIPRNLTAGLRKEVVEAILAHVEATVGRRLAPEFPLAQIQRIGIPPRIRPIDASSIQWQDALQALAELTIAGVLPRLRSASGQLEKAPGRSGVQEFLASRFRGPSPSVAYQHAVKWARIAGDQIMPSGGIGAALVDAWRYFQAWFELLPEATRWEEYVPNWTVLVPGQGEIPVLYDANITVRILPKKNPYTRGDENYDLMADLFQGAPKRLKISRMKTLLRRHHDFDSKDELKRKTMEVAKDLQAKGVLEFLGVSSN